MSYYCTSAFYDPSLWLTLKTPNHLARAKVIQHFTLSLCDWRCSFLNILVQDVATVLWETLMIPWKVQISALKIVPTLPNANSSCSRAGTEWARGDTKAWVEMGSLVRTLKSCLEDDLGQAGWEGIQKPVADQAGASESSPGKEIQKAWGMHTPQEWWNRKSPTNISSHAGAFRKVSFRNPELAGIMPHSFRKL